MATKEGIIFLDIILTKCDCCEKMVQGFYSIDGEWWDKYIKPNEGNICLGCIADRIGFREEYQQLFGISVERGLEWQLKG